MRSSKIAKLASVVLVGSCIGIAGAQTSGASGLSVRAGWFWPSSTEATDLGNNWFGLGLDYKLNTLSAKAPVVGTQAYFGISADYYSRGGDNDLPVALTYNIKQSGFLFSAGIGPDFVNAGDITGNSVGISEQVGVGYDILPGPVPVFIQAKYYFASKPELSGLGVYLGVRF